MRNGSRITITFMSVIAAAALAPSAMAQEAPSVPAAPPVATAPAPAAPEASVAGGWKSVSFSADDSFGCGVKRSGALYCWGHDSVGQLGDGLPLSDQASAVRVGNGSDWKQVSAGGEHTCAVTTGGRLYCFGADDNGQLGDGGSNTLSSVPVEVRGGVTTWKSVSAGRDHTCARRANRTIWCWGDDDSGQVGDGAGAGAKTRPTQVGSATTWTSVSAGADHSCGRQSSGRLYCWGSNTSGQSGTASANTFIPSPAEVAGGATNWSSVVAGGHHTCAVKVSQRLFCWGDDSDGQLGDGGTTTNQPTPVQVSGPTADWSSVSLSLTSTCALRTTSRLYCWGEDDRGQLGDGGTNTDAGSPVEVSGAANDWAKITAGNNTSCATKRSGRLLCWGSDSFGALSEGEGAADSSVPVDALDAETFATVSAGRNHTCGLTDEGRLFCWGLGTSGQRGDGTNDADGSLPVEVAGGFTTWARISVGGDHTCATRTNGRLYCWGKDTNGQLGIGGGPVDTNVPVQVSGGATDWADVSAGEDHTCATRTTGRLFCWGADGSGRLGNGGADTDAQDPAEVSGGLTTWSKVSAGNAHTCAVRTNGRLFCWGDDGSGRLGNGGADTPSNVPVQVAGAETNWLTIGAGGSHSCARKLTGRLYCWGDDTRGQLGDDVTIDSQSTPVEVSGAATDWFTFELGDDHTCARKESGRLLCWGSDDSGRRGDGGTDTDAATPIEVAGGYTDWSVVSAGAAHTCGRRATGRVMCFGIDSGGKLGNGFSLGSTSEPSQVRT